MRNSVFNVVIIAKQKQFKTKGVWQVTESNIRLF